LREASRSSAALDARDFGGAMAMGKDLSNKTELGVGNHVIIIAGCAIAAGLCIPFAWFGIRRVSVMRWINPPSWRYILIFTLVCLVSYLTAGLIVVGVKWFRRASFSWLLVATFGSMILATVYKFKLYHVGGGSISSEMSVVRVNDALESALWLSMFTLPFSAAVYYTARAMSRKQHE
jgi:hypothetical protein